MSAFEHNLVRIRKLWAGYSSAGPAVVRGVNLDIDKGQVLCLVGASGAGKSTLGHVLAGIFRHFMYQGDIEVLDQPVMDSKRRSGRRYRGGIVSLVSQDPEQYFDPLFKIGFQMKSAVKSHLPISGKKARQRLKEAMINLGLSDAEAVMAAYPHELSGGMKARVALALSVVLKPRLIIADEVTSALDPITAVKVLDLLKELQSATFGSILLITHDLTAAARIGDHIAVMLAGRIVETGPIKDVLATPRHPYTYTLIEAHRMNRNTWVRHEGRMAHESTPDACPFMENCPRALPDCAKWSFKVNEIPGNRTIACLNPMGPN